MGGFRKILAKNNMGSFGSKLIIEVVAKIRFGNWKKVPFRNLAADSPPSTSRVPFPPPPKAHKREIGRFAGFPVAY